MTAWPDMKSAIRKALYMVALILFLCAVYALLLKLHYGPTP